MGGGLRVPARKFGAPQPPPPQHALAPLRRLVPTDTVSSGALPSQSYWASFQAWQLPSCWRPG